MVFPLYDENPFKLPVPPYVTWGLIATNIVLFLFMLGETDAQQTGIFMSYAVIPAALTGSFAAHQVGWADLTLVTSLFLHGGWEHILGNMIYLWVFGDDIEEALGPGRFIVFYILAGIAASLAFVAVNPHSASPLIGASGAISGVLAAYLMLRPCAEVSVFVLRFVVRVRAFWVIGGWVLLQLFNLIGSSGDGVAYGAHIGGLVAGAALFYWIRPAGVTLFECMDTPESGTFPSLDRNTLT